MDITKLYQKALALAIFIVIYNIIEAFISMYLGYKDESLTLFGFGADSLIEVASNLGVIYMITRIQKNIERNRSKNEKIALRITGYGFYLLSIALAVGIIINIFQNHQPNHSLYGVIISIISIAVMTFVVYKQLDTGKKLQSAPIIADAKCTLVCVYMSIILLISSAVYYFTGFAYTDSLGAIGLIYFSIIEGKECLEKAQSNKLCACAIE